MALTFEQLQRLVKGEKLNYFIAPDRPMVRFGVTGLYGRYEVVVHLQDDGRFLQFRTVNYHTCAEGDPNLHAVLQTMASLNYTTRLVKLGRDPSDGEIVAYADHWVMDNQVTQEQFSRMMSNYLPSIDRDYHRIKTAAETGKDPGDPPVTSPPGAGAPGGLPPELRELLDRVRKGGGPEPSPGGRESAPIEEI